MLLTAAAGARIIAVAVPAEVFDCDIRFTCQTLPARRAAESNGCAVFRDYARFLAAYKKGKIKRLVVVPRLNEPLTRAAQDGRGA
ncbi:hypothetical protein MESS2_730142 [Mesorhizobium metallidurans STM 2683]|uniref:Uncharacterized protein n=1 Tax=Mesorhizobium metallidurans STM 2683 TaxID=1297569 RepID=M5F8L9_9HYPH|nr:hypothetical protein [Mesorhizobium metallidurans]CCV08246.1 hypothetical protein MESS2_730142 [Mesorhizobium metallidurans STM 2683]